MWIVLQVNSNKPEEWITTNELRFQAYTAMAFGAENITWACYTAGWWHNQVLDEHGEKTEQYDKLKAVNTEIHTLAREYMKYRRTATHFVGFSPESEWLANVEQTPVPSLDTGIFMNVHAQDHSELVIGQMVSRTNDGSCALMIAAADDPYDRNPRDIRVLFKCNDKKINAIGGLGKIPVIRLDENTYAVDIKSNAGVLITAR